MSVEERPIAIDEIKNAAPAGTLAELFATGTAAVVSPIVSITHDCVRYKPAARGLGPVARGLFDRLTGIQYGPATDPRGWSRLVVAAAIGEKVAD